MQFQLHVATADVSQRKLSHNTAFLAALSIEFWHPNIPLKRISTFYESVFLLNALYLAMKCHSVYLTHEQFSIPHHQSRPLQTIKENFAERQLCVWVAVWEYLLYHSAEDNGRFSSKLGDCPSCITASAERQGNRIYLSLF